MAASSGPKIVTENLGLAVDSRPESRAVNQQSNLLYNNFPLWTITSAVGYSNNGDGNTRIIDTNPWGIKDVVWDVSNQDATSDADGGWNTDQFDVDETKLYRFSVWIKRPVIGNGSTYLGCHGYYNGGATNGILNRSNGATNTNPYFRSASWTWSADEWYLWVGHVWPSGSGTGDPHPDTGIYDLAGNKLNTPGDFVWVAGTTRANHRSYLYYSTNTATRQQFYDPRVDVCDGSQPSIYTLINRPPTSLDLTNNTFVPRGLATLEADGLTFDGSTGEKINLGKHFVNFGSNVTIETWFKSTAPDTSDFSLMVGWGDVNANYSNVGIGNWYGAHTNESIYIGLNSSAVIASYLGGHTLYHDGQWHHAVFTMGVNNYKIYVDGVDLPLTFNLGNQATDVGDIFSFGNSNVEVWLGNRPYSSGNGPWTGNIPVVRFYDKILSAQEVQKNFSALRGRFGI